MMASDYKQQEENRNRLVLKGEKDNTYRGLNEYKLAKLIPSDSVSITTWAKKHGYKVPTGMTTPKGTKTVASRIFRSVLKEYFRLAVNDSIEEIFPYYIASMVRVRRIEINPKRVKLTVRFVNGTTQLNDGFNYYPLYHVHFKLAHSFSGLNKYYRRLSHVKQRSGKGLFTSEMYKRYPKGNHYNII